jgi:hypothetical protein
MARVASKKLLKELPTEQEMRDILTNLRSHGAAATALLSAAYLEHTLEAIFRAFFRNLNSEDDTRMFDGAAGGILGTFAAKIRVAYAMRTIDKNMYDDLLLINDIRNVFGHSLHRVTFDHELVAVDCGKFSGLADFRRMGLQLPKAIDQFSHATLTIYIWMHQKLQQQLTIKYLRRGAQDA